LSSSSSSSSSTVDPSSFKLCSSTSSSSSSSSDDDDDDDDNDYEASCQDHRVVVSQIKIDDEHVDSDITVEAGGTIEDDDAGRVTDMDTKSEENSDGSGDSNYHSDDTKEFATVIESSPLDTTTGTTVTNSRQEDTTTYEHPTESSSNKKVVDDSTHGTKSEVKMIECKKEEPNCRKPSDLKVSVITWNLAEQLPSEDDASFLKRFRDGTNTATTTTTTAGSAEGSDIILIGSQETENTKPRRAEGSRSRELRRLMIKMLGKDYTPLALHNLGGVQLGLFCKTSIVEEVEYVSIADVACGVGNVFHNKGAISAFVQMKARNDEGDVSSSGSCSRRENHVNILFVACHLAAHVKNVDARNADYWRIANELEAHILGDEKELGGRKNSRNSPPSQFVSSHTSSKKKNGDGDGGKNLMKSMDHIFFCGDLNYRIDLPREITEQKILDMRSIIKSSSSLSLSNDDGIMPSTSSSSSSLTDDDEEKRHLLETLRLDLLRHDQLIQAVSEGRAFPGLTEGEIRFPPTFKFDKGSPDAYDASYKQRIPAWTDRILHRPFGVRVLDYNSVPTSTSSDHRPVYGTYLVDMLGRKRNDEKDGDNYGSETMVRRKKSRKRRTSRKADTDGSRSRTVELRLDGIDENT